tara:strand:+ start:2710 stop:3345 length:636 start_codon:yes stop_codon:yes gene_type:complete
MPRIVVEMSGDERTVDYKPTWNNGENICEIAEVEDLTADWDERDRKQILVKYKNYHFPDISTKHHYFIVDRKDAHESHPNYRKNFAQNVRIEKEGLHKLLVLCDALPKDAEPTQLDFDTDDLLGKIVGVNMRQEENDDGTVKQFKNKKGEMQNVSATPLNGRDCVFKPTADKMESSQNLVRIKPKNRPEAVEVKAAEPVQSGGLLDDEIPF